MNQSQGQFALLRKSPLGLRLGTLFLPVQRRPRHGRRLFSGFSCCCNSVQSKYRQALCGQLQAKFPAGKLCLAIAQQQ